MTLLSLGSFVKVCVEVIAKEDGESLVLSLCLFELVKSISSSLSSIGQIKGLSSSFGLSVNHRKRKNKHQLTLVSRRSGGMFNALDTRLAGVVLCCVLGRENSN